MNELITIDFYGMAVEVLKVEDGTYWVPVKRICENIGIKYRTQFNKLKVNKIIKGGTLKGHTFGGIQELFCIRKDFLGGWL